MELVVVVGMEMEMIGSCVDTSQASSTSRTYGALYMCVCVCGFGVNCCYYCLISL